MKKILTLISLILIFATVLTFASCDILLSKPVENPDTNNSVDNDGAINREGLWENATYLASTELGEGAKTVKVQVVAGGQSITFTINTDALTLGDALFEHGLIAGDQGAYGLYVKTVNGILADYDVDQTYWAFYKDGEMMMTGVDGTEISDGEHYELIKQK